MLTQHHSAGQKIKLVIAACLWNNPQVRRGLTRSLCVLVTNYVYFTSSVALVLAQICVLDEPSNFLDREALGGLAVAIRDWAGAVVRLCPRARRARHAVLIVPLQVIISHNEEFVTALCTSQMGGVSFAR